METKRTPLDADFSDRSCLERDRPLWPGWRRESLEAMEETWTRVSAGEEGVMWDCDYCDLQASINMAEVGGAITSEQAWYLREKYLGLKRV